MEVRANIEKKIEGNNKKIDFTLPQKQNKLQERTRSKAKTQQVTNLLSARLVTYQLSRRRRKSFPKPRADRFAIPLRNSPAPL